MSFFTGFATGLAKSVDTQLKESIERTRDNIDMVSKWRLKKAEEREKERKAKDKEIQTLIQDAAYVISGNQNDVDAQNIAAALYKERGLSGFTDDIAFMREQSKTGVRPLDFIQRAKTDLPEQKFGLSEIVRSLSDAESSFAASDMVFPKGTIKGSGLISALVPDFDVTAAGGAQAKEQMKQIGFTTTPTALSLSFDRYTFDRESLGYATKSVNEKLSYLRNIVDDPTADPDLAAKAGERLNELLNKSMTGEEGSAIQAINLQLARLSTQDTSAMSEMQFKAFDTEQSGLIERRQTLEDTIALRDAKTPKERLAIEANIAFREDRMEDGYRLMAESEDYGVQVTNATLINRIKCFKLHLQSEPDYMNSTGKYANDGFKEDRARIKTIEANEQALVGISFDKVEAFRGYISRAALAEFKAQHPNMYKDLNVSTDEDGQIDSDAFIAALTGAGADATEKYNSILTSVAQRYKTVGAQYNVPEGVIDSAITLLTGKGLPDASGDVAGAGTGADDTDAALAAASQDDGILDFEMPTDKVMLNELQVSTIENKYPNDTSGATAIVADLAAQGNTFDQIVAGVSDIHDASFAAEVKKVSTTIETAVDAAVAENPISDITTTESTVILSGQKKSAVVAKLASELNLPSDAVSVIVDNAVEKANAPIRMSADKATVENVMNVLDKEGLITLGGGVAPMRREKAIFAVANAFSINPADAEGILDNALRASKPDAPETTDERIKRLKPDVVFDEDAIQALFRGRPTFPPRSGPVPYRRIGDQFYEIKDDGTLSDKPASRSITRELLKKLGGKTSDVIDKITAGLSKEDASEDASTKTVLDAQEQVTETEFKPSAIQLAMKFIDGTLEGEERSAFRKELTGPNGKELAAAIQMIRDRRKAEKEVSAYRSRGGLMGR